MSNNPFFNAELLQNLRTQQPLVLNITNIVVSNYVANGLLAIGASPIMSNAIEEMEELATICGGVSINIGTLTTPQIDAMLAAGKTANVTHTPVLLDPVGVGATKFRQSTTKKLLEEIEFTAIRGNIGELAFLAEVDWNAKGVDAGNGEGNTLETANLIAKTVAKKYNTIAIVSGEVDVISDGKTTVQIANGTPLFPQITGSGCLHGAVCSAFLTLANLTDQKDILTTCVTACVSYAIAGQIIAKADMRSGGFTTALIDGLSKITVEDVNKLANITLIND